ncbi:branched-chain amino acid aminotransferase II [Nemania serpens]|nr:branched-chain amino acid aminotransferase II [Nemania serpens]
MFPPPPKENIDWDKLPFDVYETDGHVESHYSRQTGEWSEPQFVTDPILRLHGLTPALMYAQQAFEGIKAYRTPSGEIQVFRPQKNARRMMQSVSYISVPPVPEERFLRCVKLAVARNATYVPPHGAAAALYIRPIIFGSSTTLAMASPDKYTFCVYVTPVGVVYGVKAIKALISEDYDRVAPEGSGRAKVGGNYSPLVRHINAASASDYSILLHLDSKTRTEIDEFSMSGFVGIKTNPDEDGNGTITYTLVVPTPTRTIDSVTSDSISQIAEDLGWKTECRTVRYDELPTFTEVLAVGTAGALVPIKSITRKSTGDVFSYNDESDEHGPCGARLLSILKDIQQGNIEDRFGWCTRVVDVSH